MSSVKYQPRQGGTADEQRQRQGKNMNPGRDLVSYCRQYTRERPEVVAMACFGLGFILGWKLKPW